MLLKSSIVLSGLFALAIVGSHAELPAQDADVSSAQRESSRSRSSQGNSEQPELEMTVFRLKHISAHEAVEVLNQTIRSHHSRVAAESRSNSLIFNGTEEEAARVSELLETLDQPAGDVGDIKIFPLEHANCHEMVNNLQRLFNNKQLTFVADSRTNSILAQGSADDLAIAEAIITRLDLDNTAGDGQANGDEAQSVTFRVFNLSFTDAVQVASVIQQLAGSMPVSIAPDSEHNSLIVKGPEAQVEVVAGLITKLDTEREVENRILTAYKLADISVEEAISVVQTLLANRSSSARISYSAENNSIIFYGTEEEHDLVQAILQELNAISSVTVATSAPVGAANLQGSYKVRLIWLSDDGESDSALPEDLHSVAEELSAYGFNNLEVAGQLMVNTTGHVESAGQISRSNGRFELHGEGFLEESGDRLKLSLKIGILQSTFGEGGAVTSFGLGQVAQTSTEIFTQPGNLTVLGVSPSQSSTAIFVVQILEN